MPILPVRGTVVFPFLVVPLMANEQKQARLIDEALMRGSVVGLFLQTDQSKDDPGPSDIYEVGTSGNILKMLRFPDGTIRFLVQGLSRIRIKKFISSEPFLIAEVEDIVEKGAESVKMEALQRNLLERLKVVIDLSPNLSEELYISAINQETASKLADLMASNLNFAIKEKQDLLEEVSVYKRMEKLLTIVNREIEVLELSQENSVRGPKRTGEDSTGIYSPGAIESYQT